MVYGFSAWAFVLHFLGFLLVLEVPVEVVLDEKLIKFLEILLFVLLSGPFTEFGWVVVRVPVPLSE